MISGLGECAWCIQNGFEGFSAIAVNARQFDVSYTAGWDMLNYWPNLLQGMNASRHTWKQKGCTEPDRVNATTGWGGPLVEWVQRGFSPYLAMDVQAYQQSPSFVAGWPNLTANTTIAPGGTQTRQYIVFNDGLTDETLTLDHSAVCDDAAGRVVEGGRIVGVHIQAGYHSEQLVTFNTPEGCKGRVQLVVEVLKGAEVVFTEDRVHLMVSD